MDKQIFVPKVQCGERSNLAESSAIDTTMNNYRADRSRITETKSNKSSMKEKSKHKIYGSFL